MGDATVSTPVHPPRPSMHVVAQPLGEGAVLIHLQTNQIYELNKTARRVWESLVEGLDRAEIAVRLQEEFLVSDQGAERAIDRLLAMLEAEQLITTDDGSSH